MPNLIDKTAFVGELDIPTNNSGVENLLEIFIVKYESRFLEGVLGTELYEEPASEEKTALLNILKPALACYVYFKWINNQAQQNVGLGVVETKAENSNKVSHMWKAYRAMNECRSLLTKFYSFMFDNALYPLWDGAAFNTFYYEEIHGINPLNV